MNIHALFDKYFQDKKILLLGFGHEGKAAYAFFKKYYPDLKLGIADRNKVTLPEYDSFTAVHSGENYLDAMFSYEVVLKSPGISLPIECRRNGKFVLTSQTEIFLEVFASQIIGITGTKGKSTTASLLHHIFKSAGRASLLGGNIGRPVFELLEEITTDTLIVLELSSHQLQYVNASPHLGVLLNVYPEHLDYYRTFEDYKNAKMNITVYQGADDSLIYPLTEFLNINTDAHKSGFLLTDVKENTAVIKFKQADCWQEFKIDRKAVNLPGEHNLYNIGSAAIAAILSGCKPEAIYAGIYSFQGLKHRLQEVAEIDKIHFINDSISTIPETTIAALKVYDRCVESLILGGHSRGEGISFKKLAEEILKSDIENLFFLPETGRKIYEELLNAGALEQRGEESGLVTISCNAKIIRCFFGSDFESIVKTALQYSSRHKKNKICLLSPASTSYNMFKNFEERGDAFINAVQKCQSLK